MVVQELVTLLGFEVDDKQVKQYEKTLKSALAVTATITAGAVAFTAALFANSKAAADNAGAITRLANSSGVAVDVLQSLGYAAKLSGTDMNELAGGLRYLAKSGSKNVTADFLALSSAIVAVEDPAAKVRLAMDKLGKNGAGLVELLNKGPQGIQALTTEFERMGGALSGQELATLSAFNDELDSLLSVFRSVRNYIALQISPVFVRTMKAFKEWYLTNKQLINQHIEIYFGIIGGVLTALARTVQLIFEAFAKWPVLFNILGAAAVALGIKLAIAFAPVLGPILLIIAAIVALGLVIEDIYTFFEGGDSLTGRIVKAVGAYFDKLIENVKDRFSRLVEFFTPLAQDIYQIFVKPFVDLFSFIFNGFKTVGGWIAKVLPNSPLAKSWDSTSAVVQRSSPSSSPLPGLGGGASGPVSVSMQTSIVVPPGTDPVSVGDRVEKGTNDAWGNTLDIAARFATGTAK